MDKAPTTFKNESRKARRQRQRREARERARQALEKLRPGTLLSTIFSPFWLMVEVLLAVCGGYVFLFQLPAQFSVSSQALLNPSNPLSTQFTLTNDDGFFDAHDVQPSCEIASLKDITGNEFSESKGEDETVNYPQVQAKDRITIPCIYSARMNPIKSADITLLLSYRSSFLFWRRYDRFRFQLTFSNEDNPVWLQQPVK